MILPRACIEAFLAPESHIQDHTSPIYFQISAQSDPIISLSLSQEGRTKSCEVFFHVFFKFLICGNYNTSNQGSGLFYVSKLKIRFF